MNNVQTEMRIGLVSRLLSVDSEFKTAVTEVITVDHASLTDSKLFYVKAPSTLPNTQRPTELPYVVFNFLHIDPSRDSVNRYYKATIQFNVYATNPTDSESIAKQLADLLDDCEATLIITGYKVVGIDLISQLNLGGDNGVWTTVLQYSLEIQQ